MPQEINPKKSTYERMVYRVFDALENQQKPEVEEIAPNLISESDFTGAKILEANLTGEHFHFPTWNGLLRETKIRAGISISFSGDALLANEACNELISIVQKNGFSLDITIAWWGEPNGRKARIYVPPKIDLNW